MIIALSLATINVKSQDILKSKDLSTIKVDQLSDEDILKYEQQLQQSGLSETQAEQLAIQKGFPSSEIIKLRARLAGINASSYGKKTENNPQGGSRTYDYDTTQLNRKPFEKLSLRVFGSELFNNNNLTFEPNLRIATPKNYVIGPDDEIVIDVFGYQEVNQRAIVSPEGNINIPNVGMIAVNGLTVEQATKRIREKMIHSGYASINNNQSQIQVSIGKIRSIRVTVIGEAKRPGSYTLSSLSTLFNALYSAGGPTEKGSFRQIEVVRNGVVVVKMDAYRFLLKGDQTKNIRLMDQDVVRIPVAKVQAVVKGEIRNPAIYEVLNGESLSDVIEFAGSFTSTAYTASVHITQVTDKEKRIKDVDKADFKNYQPLNGDEIVVSKILDRFDNRITLNGAVYRPGNYELTPGLTLSQLIQRADGLKEDAFIQRGILVRINQKDLTKEVISFSIPEIFSSPLKDILLQKNDEITIGSSAEFKDSTTITIEGEVRKPGIYSYYTNKTLKDVLFEAGGLTDASSIDRIEIARRLNVDKAADSSSDKLSEIIQIGIDKDLTITGNNVKLQPWDVIMVRSKPGYKPQVSVSVEGEIQYPGIYVLASKEDRVSELIKRAGGLTKQAFVNGINLSRINTSLIKDTNDVHLKKIQQQTKDTSGIIQDYIRPVVNIGLEMNKIIDHPGGREDIVLQEGDVLNVPKEKREIKVSGEVLFPTEVVYIKGHHLNYYIDRAGGFTDNARKSKVFVLRPNGIAAKTKHFLFFKRYPKVEAGSEILVPKKVYRVNRTLSVTEMIAITSSLASLAYMVVALMRL